MMRSEVWDREEPQRPAFSESSEVFYDGYR
jgi:hypothetical protein